MTDLQEYAAALRDFELDRGILRLARLLFDKNLKLPEHTTDLSNAIHYNHKISVLQHLVAEKAARVQIGTIKQRLVTEADNV